MSDAFFHKMFLNFLKGYDFDYPSDSTLKAMVGRLYVYPEHHDWLRSYNEKYRVYAETNDKEYATPHKFLKKADIKEFLALADESTDILRKPFEMLPNTKVLGEVLDLNHTEQMILDLAIRLSAGGHTYDYNIILNTFQYEYRTDEAVNRLYALLLDLKEDDIKEARKGFLFQSGMLVTDEALRTFWRVHGDLGDAFSMTGLSLESLAQRLFPSNISTDLTVDDYPHMSKEIKRCEDIIANGLRERQPGTNVMFWGIPGTGKTELSLALAKKNGWNIRVIGDVGATDQQEKSRAQRLTSLKVAMKLYSNDENTVLLFDEMEDLFKADLSASFSKAFINRIIEKSPLPIIWTTNSLTAIGDAVLRRMIYNIGFDVPPVSARRTIWKNYLTKYEVVLEDDVIEELASDFAIAPALISNAVKVSRAAGVAAEEFAEVVSSLDTLVNYGTKRKKAISARKDTPYDASCVNSDLDMNELTEQLVQAEPNWSMLLYGAPGTGKSEYGRHVASRLGKKVLFKRASDLQSMWLGECEKNIAEAFAEAREEGMVLIIDEGDSFLQNREKAQRSWEVSQVNEMLSQMEMHTEPFIMTTNLMQDLDPASMRRFTFKMKFDFMRPDQSRRLFKQYFGVEAPAELDRNEILAPGDFANVWKKAKILKITDASKIYDMIVEECEVKPMNWMKIGF